MSVAGQDVQVASPVSLVPAYLAVLVTGLLLVLGLVPNQPAVLWAGALGVWAVTSLALTRNRSQAGVGLIVAVTAALWKQNIAALPLDARLWGALATAVTFGVLLVRPLRRSRGYPLLHLYCLVQGIYLYGGFMLGRPIPSYRVFFTDTARTRGLALYAVFMTVLVVSGIAAPGWRRPAHIDDAPLEQPSRDSGEATAMLHRGFLLIAVGYIVVSVVNVAGLAGPLGAIAQLLQLVPLTGALTLVVLWLRGELGVIAKTALVAIGALYVLSGIGTGLIYQGIGALLAVLCVVVVYRRRVPWFALAAAVPLFVILNLVKTEFRIEQSQGRLPGNVVIQGAHLVGMSWHAVATTDEDAIGASAARFDSSDLLGYVANNVPSRYPYWSRRSYTYLPLVLAPRAIAPWKPKYTLANEFGRRYGLLDPDDRGTSVNTSLPVEAYVNFGLPGMLVVGVVVGLILAVGARSLRGRSPDVLIVGALLSLQTFGAIESGVSSLLLLLPTYFLFRPLARWACATGRFEPHRGPRENEPAPDEKL